MCSTQSWGTQLRQQHEYVPINKSYSVNTTYIEHVLLCDGKITNKEGWNRTSGKELLLVVPSHIQTLLSRLQVARRDPPRDQLTPFTSFSCPSSVAEHSNSPPFRSQMAVVPSKLTDARYEPQGDQSRQRTVRWWPPSRTVLHTHVSPRNTWSTLLEERVWMTYNNTHPLEGITWNFQRMKVLGGLFFDKDRKERNFPHLTEMKQQKLWVPYTQSWTGHLTKSSLRNSKYTTLQLFTRLGVVLYTSKLWKNLSLKNLFETSSYLNFRQITLQVCRYLLLSVMYIWPKMYLIYFTRHPMIYWWSKNS